MTADDVEKAARAVIDAVNTTASLKIKMSQATGEVGGVPFTLAQTHRAAERAAHEALDQYINDMYKFMKEGSS